MRHHFPIGCPNQDHEMKLCGLCKKRCILESPFTTNLPIRLDKGKFKFNAELKSRCNDCFSSPVLNQHRALTSGLIGGKPTASFQFGPFQFGVGSDIECTASIGSSDPPSIISHGTHKTITVTVTVDYSVTVTDQTVVVMGSKQTHKENYEDDFTVSADVAKKE